MSSALNSLLENLDGRHTRTKLTSSAVSVKVKNFTLQCGIELIVFIDSTHYDRIKCWKIGRHRVLRVRRYFENTSDVVWQLRRVQTSAIFLYRPNRVYIAVIKSCEIGADCLGRRDPDTCFQDGVE